MNLEKTAYWLALTAFGFALLGVCPRGALQNLNHTLGHTESTLCRLVTHAEQAVMASALFGHPQAQATHSWSAVGARELAQQQTENLRDQVEQARVQYQDQYRNQYEEQIERAQDRAQQERDEALAKADAMREQALANAAAVREETLAKAEALHEQALAQAAIARAEVEMKRAAIQNLTLRVRPQVHISHAASRRLLTMSNDLMSNDPCDYGRMAEAVRASIEISGDEQ
jgi:hypothetical protein